MFFFPLEVASLLDDSIPDLRGTTSAFVGFRDSVKDVQAVAKSQARFQGGLVALVSVLGRTCCAVHCAGCCNTILQKKSQPCSVEHHLESVGRPARRSVPYLFSW